eukprot:jgi/Chlat1/30/ChrspC231419S00912
MVVVVVGVVVGKRSGSSAGAATVMELGGAAERDPVVILDLDMVALENRITSLREMPTCPASVEEALGIIEENLTIGRGGQAGLVRQFLPPWALPPHAQFYTGLYPAVLSAARALDELPWAKHFDALHDIGSPNRIPAMVHCVPSYFRCSANTVLEYEKTVESFLLSSAKAGVRF